MGLNVSACLATRGDVDLGQIVGSLDESGIEDIVVWDNSKGKDLGVYGRYAGIELAKHDLIYVQDDDCVLPSESIKALIRAWKDTRNAGLVGKTGVLNLHSADTDNFIVSNMPQPFRHDFYSDHCLVGFGAVFHRDLPERAFRRFVKEYGRDYPSILMAPVPADWPIGFFLRTADIVFTALTPRILVDVPYCNLPWATDGTRMYRQGSHQSERAEMLRLVRKVRDA